MLRYVVISIFLVAISLCGMTTSETSVNLRTSREFQDKGYTKITGDMAFYWEKFLSYNELAKETNPPSGMISVPGNWNGITTLAGKLPARGFATIVITVTPPRNSEPLLLKLPAIRTTYSLYADSTHIVTVGKPAITADEAVPKYMPQVVSLPPFDSTFNLLFHISNFDNNKGGPWKPIYIGTEDPIYKLQRNAFAYDLFLIGALLFFVFINATTYRFSDSKWKRRAILSLTAFTLANVFRTAVTNQRFLYFLLPSVPSSIFVQIEYISFFIAILFFHYYIHFTVDEFSPKRVTRLVLYTVLLFVAVVVVTPLRIHSNLIPIAQVFMFLLGIFQLIIIYKSRNKKGPRSILLLISMLIIFITTLHDVLGTLYSTHSGISFTPLGNLTVVLLQTIILNLEHAITVKQRAEMRQRLSEINKTLNSFVPQEIFSLLDTPSDEISPGLQKECDITIFIADIRDFTALSERMSPEMNFSFINRFLATVTPIISKHNGFINNFIGDAFVAVFTGNPMQAVQAALEIQSELKNGELFSPYMLDKPVELGIGIEYGKTTVGIVGGSTRMENTLLGHAVSRASRLEELTKITGASIMITNSIAKSLPDNRYSTRHLGYDFINNNKDLDVIEIYVSENSPETRKKRRGQKQVEQAVCFMLQKRYDDAVRCLENIPHEISHHDKAISYLLEVCRSEILIQNYPA